MKSTCFARALGASCLVLAPLAFDAAAADPDLKPGFPVQLIQTNGTYHAGPGVHALVGNIDADANLEILTSSAARGPTYAIKADGTLMPGWPIMDNLGMAYMCLGRFSAGATADQVFAGFFDGLHFAFDGNLNVLPGWPVTAANYVSSPAALVDIDGDGIDEIFIGEEDFRLHGYRADGTPLPGWPASAVAIGSQAIHTPAIADLDGDGVPEIIVATEPANGRIAVYAYKVDGSIAPGFPVPIERGNAVTYVSVGDVDGDGSPEIVLLARDPLTYPYQSVLLILGADGSTKRVIRTASNVVWGTAPTLADLDGDRIPEIIIQGDNMVEVWKGDGTPFPGWPREMWGMAESSAPVVGDVDGDGRPDIVVVQSSNSNPMDARVYVFDRTGNVHPRFPKAIPAGGGATPAIADLDRDGRNDIVIVGTPWAGVVDYYDSVWVYDLGGGPHGRIEWGQFAGGPKHHGRYVSPLASAAPVADIGVQVDVSPAIRFPGEPLTFTLTVANPGPQSAGRVRVTHDLDPAFTFVSASAGCALRGGTLTCDLGTVAPGDSAQAQLTVVSPMTGTRASRSIALSDASDPALADNDVRTSVSVVLPNVDLAVTATDSPDPARFGQNVTYTIVARNLGPDTSKRVVVQDRLGDVNFVSASAGCGLSFGLVACDVGTLTAGESRTLSVTVTPRTRRSTVTNTVTIAGEGNDTNSANNSATQTTTVK